MTLNVMLGNSKLGLMLQTGQTTQYNSEPDDGLTRKGLAKSYTVLSTGQYSGNTNIDLTHLISSTASFDGPTHTITDAGKCGVFKAAGGESIVISGATDPANNGTFTSASATANTLVLTAGLATEGAGASITFKKRESHANACVQDNNTGLMWQRTMSSAVGALGTGTMPWTGFDYDIFRFAAEANAVGLSGYTDWRIPNWNEMASILDHEAPTGRPDATAWPTFANETPWTSTTVPSDTTRAHYCDFQTGDLLTLVKTNAGKVLLVRGG